MKGTIIGDIVGSAYERRSIKSKDFKLFKTRCRFTDDTVLTAAVAEALIYCKENAVVDDAHIQRIIAEKLHQYGRNYIHLGCSKNFWAWLMNDNPQPYQGFTNGALMRCSAAGWIAETAEEARFFGKLSALPSHDHPEAITAASLAAEIIFRARTGASKEELFEIAAAAYDIPKIEEIRPVYRYDITCKGTFPVCFSAFYESANFEDAIRTAVSMGGDTDTNGAITGSFAEAFYGVPEELWEGAKSYCDDTILSVVERWEKFTSAQHK